MSWSFTATGKVDSDRTRARGERNLYRLLEKEQKRVAAFIVKDKPMKAAMLDASTTAIYTAIDVIEEGVVGRAYASASWVESRYVRGKHQRIEHPASEGKTFTVELSGHSNPDHEPREGWENDTITIRITQVSPPKE